MSKDVNYFFSIMIIQVIISEYKSTYTDDLLYDFLYLEVKVRQDGSMGD